MQTTQKPAHVISEGYCNRVDAPGYFDFIKSVETAGQCAWSVTAGLKYKSEVTVKADVPGVGGASAAESIELDFSATRSQSTTHKETSTISLRIPVPAHT